jgi:hypothetical protein
MKMDQQKLNELNTRTQECIQQYVNGMITLVEVCDCMAYVKKQIGDPAGLAGLLCPNTGLRFPTAEEVDKFMKEVEATSEGMPVYVSVPRPTQWEIKVPDCYMSFSGGKYRVIHKGMPICNDKLTMDEATEAVIQLQIPFTSMSSISWNGDMGEWVMAGSLGTTNVVVKPSETNRYSAEV